MRRRVALHPGTLIGFPDVSRGQYHTAGRLSRFERAVRPGHIFQRKTLVDPDRRSAADALVEQLARHGVFFFALFHALPRQATFRTIFPMWPELSMRVWAAPASASANS